MAYSNGILTLAIGAITLLFIFRGNTERLIPLYTIGVFVLLHFLKQVWLFIGVVNMARVSGSIL